MTCLRYVFWVAALLVVAPAFPQCTKLVLNPVTHKLDCNDGAGAVSSYQLFAADGSSQTARNRLNLIGGTNISLTPVDNPGTNSTDVTITSTASGNMTNTSGSGAPVASCTAGRSTYLETTNHDLWMCSATDTWKKLLSTSNSGPFVLTGATGTIPSTPASGFLSLWMSTSTGTLHSVNSSGVDTDYAPLVRSGGFAASFGSVAAGASALVADIAYLTIPYACTIAGWNINVNAGTATFDIWRIATGTAIPTVANTITAAALPAISSGTSVHSTTLSGWSTSIAANDIIAIQLKTVATATSAYLGVECNH